MKRAWKVALILAVLFLLATGLSLAWAAPQDDKMPTFGAKDREAIGAHYKTLLGTLAPGSLDRTEFPLAIEQTLVTGSRVPLQLEKELEPLPAKLESVLSMLPGGYRRYSLGRHVVLIRKADLTIADIIRNVAVK